jgi:hypothetical protein
LLQAERWTNDCGHLSFTIAKVCRKGLCQIFLLLLCHLILVESSDDLFSSVPVSMLPFCCTPNVAAL